MKTKSKTPGRRIPKPPHSWEQGQCPYKPGDYWNDDDGWHGVTPNGNLCWFKNHHVEEHEDGTISIVHGPWGSNSILSDQGRQDEWHGEIQKGTWVEF